MMRRGNRQLRLSLSLLTVAECQALFFFPNSLKSWRELFLHRLSPLRQSQEEETREQFLQTQLTQVRVGCATLTRGVRARDSGE